MGGGAWGGHGICLNKDEKNDGGGSQGRRGWRRRERTAVPRSIGTAHLPISSFAPSDVKTLRQLTKLIAAKKIV